MRIFLSLILLASVAVNAALFQIWQRDEAKLRETAEMRVKIYDSARQIISDLKDNDPLTFTNVTVPEAIR